MTLQQVEQNLIDGIFKMSKLYVLTPSNLGIFKSGTKDNILQALDNLDLHILIRLSNRDEYDRWYNEIVREFHKDVFELYRGNLIIEKDNPYSYSARLLNQYLKFLTTRTWLFDFDGENYIRLLHPILTNKFFKTFHDLGFSMVNQIKGATDYYASVEYSRQIIDGSIYIDTDFLNELEYGTDF